MVSSEIESQELPVHATSHRDECRIVGVREPPQSKSQGRLRGTSGQDLEPTRLLCVVVGRPGAFLVDIAPDAVICELQDVILEKQKYTGFPASELTLFLVKQHDSWLALDVSNAKALMRGDEEASAGRLGDNLCVYGAATIQGVISGGEDARSCYE